MEKAKTSDSEQLIFSSEEYFKTRKIDELRKNEFYRLDREKHIYLDYTGGGLYGDSQLAKHFEFLKTSVLGNPHSTNPSSQAAEQAVHETRKKILEYFNADDYYCVFTSNATGAIKIIGESYPFDRNSFLLLTFDNHNSVNGIREYAKRSDCSFSYSPINYEDLRFNKTALTNHLQANIDRKNKLFAFPAQSNVSGVKHDLEWVRIAQDNKWDVLLDASAFVPTNPLDLSVWKPEFVSMSFYKMFGYPTGLGALLVRKDAFEKLEKPWFSGGTVTLASVMADRHFLDSNHAKFEDGTINYLNIPALKIGIEFIESVGIELINKRVSLLTAYFLEELKKLKYSNGEPLVHLFGPNDNHKRGGTIILNLFDRDGKVIPFFEIEKLANDNNISIRTGCFCNPGIDEINHHLQGKMLTKYFDTREGGDYQDMVHYLHKMRGAIRVSFGIATNLSDINTFLGLIKTYLK